MEVDGVHEILFVPKPRAVYFTHWILALMDSLVVGDAVPQVGDDVLEPPFGMRAVSIMGCNRLRTAQLCHQRKCFRAGRS